MIEYPQRKSGRVVGIFLIIVSGADSHHCFGDLHKHFTQTAIISLQRLKILADFFDLAIGCVSGTYRFFLVGDRHLFLGDYGSALHRLFGDPCDADSRYTAESVNLALRSAYRLFFNERRNAYRFFLNDRGSDRLLFDDRSDA